MKFSPVLILTLLATTAAVAHDDDVEGVYVVPAAGGMAQPEEVRMQRARLSVHGDELRLDYRLPHELDGAAPQRFRLAGDAHGTFLTTDNLSAHATCTDTEAALECVMHYGPCEEHGIAATAPRLVLNHVAAEAYLADNVDDAAEVEALRTARDVLEHQAVGIVKLRRD